MSKGAGEASRQWRKGHISLTHEYVHIIIAHTNARVYVYTYIYIYVYMCVCIHVCVCMCVYMYIYKRNHAYRSILACNSWAQWPVVLLAVEEGGHRPLLMFLYNPSEQSKLSGTAPEVIKLTCWCSLDSVPFLEIGAQQTSAHSNFDSSNAVVRSRPWRRPHTIAGLRQPIEAHWKPCCVEACAWALPSIRNL